MASNSSNLDVVTAFIETNGREGLATAIQRYASEDVFWRTPGTGEIQDRIRQLADIMHSNYDANGTSFTLKRTVCEGDLVAAEYEGKGTLRNGAVYNNHFHTLFVMSEGRICEVREYHDSACANLIWAPIFAEAMISLGKA